MEDEEDVQELSEGQLWSSVEENEVKNKGKIPYNVFLTIGTLNRVSQSVLY